MTAPTSSTPAQPLRVNSNSTKEHPPPIPGASSRILYQFVETCAVGLFSTCEGTGVPSSWSSSFWNEKLHRLDYSQLHDQFLESLLREAAELSSPSNGGSQSVSSLGIPDDSDSSVLSIQSKRRLPRLRKQDSSSSSQRYTQKHLSLPPGQPYDPADPPPLLPAQFLHDHVRMQKDKGRGEEPGSVICAKGQEACLDKLRVKMQLLCNTAIQQKGASMKRRPARVSIHLYNFVETRSILEVRLGFLSMMYGILLRWDTKVTGKITLVVLRKMCHESFYPHVAAAPLYNASASGSSAEDDEEDQLRKFPRNHSIPRVVEGKAIVDWPDGTEVSILEPPYLIPRPTSFPPSLLTVSNILASGLDRKSTWMVQFLLDQPVSINLTYDEGRDKFTPKSAWQGLKFEIESLDKVLDIKLYQRTSSRKRKCCGTMQVTLSSLPIHKSPATSLLLPCKDAVVNIEVFLECESVEWTRKELEARRKASRFFSLRPSSPRPKPPPSPPALVATDDENEDSYGWVFCYMC